MTGSRGTAFAGSEDGTRAASPLRKSAISSWPEPRIENVQADAAQPTPEERDLRSLTATEK